MLNSKKTMISVAIDKDIKITLKEICEAFDMTLSALCKTLIYTALHDHNLSNSPKIQLNATFFKAIASFEEEAK